MDTLRGPEEFYRSSLVREALSRVRETRLRVEKLRRCRKSKGKRYSFALVGKAKCLAARGCNKKNFARSFLDRSGREYGCDSYIKRHYWYLQTHFNYVTFNNFIIILLLYYITLLWLLCLESRDLLLRCLKQSTTLLKAENRILRGNNFISRITVVFTSSCWTPQ